MFGILFRVLAKPGRHKDLVKFLTWDAQFSRDREKGTLRFEFYQDPENEDALYVYEAYQDLAAFDKHKKNEPYLQWPAFLDEVGARFAEVFRGEAIGFGPMSTPQA